jgi:hypothetical protein
VGDFELTNCKFSRRANLDFAVAASERNALMIAFEQDVGQDRLRVAALDDAGNRLKRAQDCVAIRFDQLHDELFL